MRLALLSNVTVDLLAGMIRKTNEVFLSAGFDTWQQELIVSASGLYEYKPDAVIVLLYANAYDETWVDRKKGIQTIDEWCGIFRTACAKFAGTPIFVSSIDISNINCHFGADERLEGFFENYFIERIQELHSNGSNIYILPVKEAISNLGRNTFYSPKMWYVGSMPYSMKGMESLTKLINRYCAVTKGAHKKCLAVDLDNTLWGGVIGEDGVNGIVLSNHKEGARFKDTQRILKTMKERGVMLAILSKNNTEDVEPVFQHPDMILQHEDFVSEVINWEPKSINIRKLAKDLNIGLDSFVFLDDNPAEREQMRAECPEVTVLDFPKDTSQLPDVVRNAYDEYFLALEVTGEDTKKTAMYRAENQRKAEMMTANSVEDFLKNLEMTMDFHLMRMEEEKRVTQLINKTNQFNVTTKRYSEEEVHEFANSRNYEIYTATISDKYGDQGLVAVLIIKYFGEEAEIDTFLMSCRVMGRLAEKEIMAKMKIILEAKGIKKLKATYVKTAKNTPVVDLFDKLGFILTLDTIPANGVKKEYVINVRELPEKTGVFRMGLAGEDL